MFNPLYLFLSITLCWQCVSSRYVSKQSLFSPHSDYSYSYSGSSPFHHQPVHSPLYSPPGTYFDQRQGVLRPFPGGGVPVLVDYHKLCSNQYVGLKAHPDEQQYYYVCKPDCVIFGKCQNLQIFNATSGQCVQHPPPEYIPTCTEIGRFPLFSDCHLYYKCEEDLQPKIYSCPASMIFSPTNKKCINGNKCTPTQISPHSSYLPEYCVNKFPPCFENGIFRSPSDCSLYYKCDLKNNGVYIQTRLRCLQGNFYDLQKNECLPAEQVSCDCIQVAELVYPKTDAIPFQPAVYPSQYDFDSLEENQYPIEQSKEDYSELNNNCIIGESESKTNDGAKSEDATTTLVPTTLETILSKNNELRNAFVLPDDTDIGQLNDKSESKEFENSNIQETTMNSEEITSVEGSGFEADSEETPVLEKANKIQETIDNITEVEEEVSQTTAITDDGSELTERPESLLGEPKIKNDIESIDTQEENITTARILTNSSQPEYCHNSVESNEINDKPLQTDTHTKDTTQTQDKNCIPKPTIANSNINTEQMKTPNLSENTRGSRSTLHEQKTADIIAVTSIPTTTRLGITKLTPITSESLKAIQLRNETTLVPQKDDLVDTLLDSERKLKTAEIIQSWKQTTTEQLTHSSDTNFKDNMMHTNPSTTSNNVTQTTQTLSVENASLIEDDVSYEDILDAEFTLPSLNATTNKPTVETAVPTHIKEMKGKAIKAQKASKATTERIDIQTTQIPLGNKELLESEETTTAKTSQATTSPAPPHGETIDNSSDFTKDNDLVLLDSKNEIEWNENALLDKDALPLTIKEADATKQPLQVHKSVSLTQVDMREDELIPAYSKSTFINESVDLTNSIADNLENEFDDDFTTILADKETTTFAAITDIKQNSQQQKKMAKNFQFFDDNKVITATKKQTTSLDKNEDLSALIALTQINLATDPSATQTTIEEPKTMPVLTKITKPKENSTDADSHSKFLNVLDSKGVVDNQSQEVSNKKITSAETKQQLPHAPSTPFTVTQTPTSTPTFAINTSPKILQPNTWSSSGPSKKHSNTLVLHVRAKDHEQPSLDSSLSKSLYYILKTKPVNISNNNDKSNNGTVAEPSFVVADSKHIPRLEIIAERPINVHFSVCPTTCAKNHEHNYSPVGKRAVLLKWYPNKSKQTLGFETANE